MAAIDYIKVICRVCPKPLRFRYWSVASKYALKHSDETKHLLDIQLLVVP